MSAPLIEFQNVTILRGGRTALDSISLTIHAGEHVALLGPNGSGKSSCIKIITRECYPQPYPDTVVRLMGQSRWDVFALRRMLGIVSNDLLTACTQDYLGREVVLSGFFSSVGIWPHHRVSPEMERKTDEVMEMLEITHLADRFVTEMSSGEARRIVLARALVHDPKALVFDEPTASLDLRAMHELQTIMRKLAQSGVSILLVTHHLPDLIPEISRVILLDQGKIFQDGPKEEVLTSENLSKLFCIPLEMIERKGFYNLW